MGTDLQVACMDRMCGNRVGELHMMEAELRGAVQRKHLSSSAYTAVDFCTVSVVSTASAFQSPNHQDP